MAEFFTHFGPTHRDHTGEPINIPLSPQATEAIGYAEKLASEGGILEVLNRMGYGEFSQGYANGVVNMFATAQPYDRDPERSSNSFPHDCQLGSTISISLGGISDEPGLRNGIGLYETHESGKFPKYRIGVEDSEFADKTEGAEKIEGPYAVAMITFNGRLEKDETGEYSKYDSARVRDFISIILHRGGLRLVTGTYRGDPLGRLTESKSNISYLPSIPPVWVRDITVHEMGATGLVREALEEAAMNVPLVKSEPSKKLSVK